MGYNFKGQNYEEGKVDVKELFERILKISGLASDMRVAVDVLSTGLAAKDEYNGVAVLGVQQRLLEVMDEELQNIISVIEREFLKE